MNLKDKLFSYTQQVHQSCQPSNSHIIVYTFIYNNLSFAGTISHCLYITIRNHFQSSFRPFRKWLRHINTHRLWPCKNHPNADNKLNMIKLFVRDLCLIIITSLITMFNDQCMQVILHYIEKTMFTLFKSIIMLSSIISINK